MDYKYYLAQLNNKEAKLYSFVYNELSNHTYSFDVTETADSINRVIKAIMLDNPELFWFEGKWEATYIENIVRVFPKYKMRLNYNKLNRDIENTVAAILKECVVSDIDNIKLVYDWLQSNIQYCYGDNDQTIEGVFIDKKAVCKGISKAFQLIMNRLNIPSFLMEGTLDGRSSHVWNVVFVDNKFYHVDVSIGYQRFSKIFYGLNRNRCYPCFMISDKTISATHMIYLNTFPKCSNDFDLNRFFVESLRVPGKFKSYGDFTYLDNGSTCTVLKAKGTRGNYVLKVIKSDKSEVAYTNGCMELEKMKLLSECNGIVRLVDSFVSEENRAVYILMHYCKPLTVRRKEDNFETIKSTLKLGIDILNSLIECRNKEIYHLDIQPKNIYFDNCDKAVLGDFGNSAFEAELNALKPKRGTLAFMAPEVYYNGTYTQASEIYSLGIILYALLNNALLPFTDCNRTGSAIKRRMSGEKLPPLYNCSSIIRNCINKMCSYDVSERFVTYEDALLEIEKIAEGDSAL